MEPIDAEWLAAEKTGPRFGEMRVPIVPSLMVAWGIVSGDLKLQERGRKFGRCNKRRVLEPCRPSSQSAHVFVLEFCTS